MTEVWLERKEVERLLGVSLRAVKKACKAGRYVTKTATGRGGRRYLIALSSLPPEAQLKYYQEEGQLQPQTQPPAPVQTSEKYKKIALARLDLVRLWRKFRAEGKKKEADNAFITAYNSGELAPNIYEILGEVSLKTLYRWINQLDGTEDWTRLLPNWNSGNKECGLTPEEKEVFMRFLLNPKNIKDWLCNKAHKVLA